MKRQPSLLFTLMIWLSLTAVAQIIGNISNLGISVTLDSDKRADTTVFREGKWCAKTSTSGWQLTQGDPLPHPDGSQYFGREFGLSQDYPVIGDFDGDGKLNIAVSRISKGELYIIPSSGYLTTWTDAELRHTVVNNRPYYFIKTIPGAVPVCGYYDADSQMDIGYYTPNDGTWHIRTW